MSQTLSYHDVDHAGAGYSSPVVKRSGGLSARSGLVTRGPTQPPAPAAVPMLDWPRDLFNDNASVDELVAVDFLMQCDAGAGATRH